MFVTQMKSEHVCTDKAFALQLQTGYLVSWTVFRTEDDKYYLNVGGDFETPIRACPFCRKSFVYGN